MTILELKYEGESYYARTWTTFQSRWKKLAKWKNIVYNHRLNYECSTFAVRRIELMDHKIIKEYRVDGIYEDS